MDKTHIWAAFVILISMLILPEISFSQTDRTYGLAVLDLEAIGISVIEAKALSEMLRSGVSKVSAESEKVKEKYNIIERSQMEKILDQFDIQSTGCTDVECAVEFGKMLNVDRIIIGSVSLVGQTYMVIARIVDVESSRTSRSVDRKQRGIIDNVIDLMPIVGHELLTGERLAAPVPTVPLTEAPVKTTPAPSTQQQAERIQEQFLSVSGTPEKAEVFLNNEKIGVTPIDYRKVNPGKYYVKIVHKGYVDFEDEIVVKPGGDESVSYRLLSYATLSFTGSPDGASVVVNDKEIGKTPIENYEIPQGTYTIKISHDGYVDFEQSVAVSYGQNKYIDFFLTALETISVGGFPAGASVFINGENVGVTPLDNHVVPEGNYKVKISSAGYETYKETVKVENGSPVEISYQLMPKLKSKVLTKSLFIPGRGQYYADYRGKGALITVLQIAAVGGAVVTSLNASNAWSDYDDAEADYKKAVSNFDVHYGELENKHDTASSASTLQMITIGVTAAVYAYNIIDALMTEPKVEVKPDFNSLRIEPRIGREHAGIAVNIEW